MQLREQFNESPDQIEQMGMPEDFEAPAPEMEELSGAPGLDMMPPPADDMGGSPPAFSQQDAAPPAGAGFNPDDSTFAERQKNMTAQERADWATKRYGTTAPAGAEAPAKRDPAADRKSFEQQIFKTIGGDPFSRDVMKEVDKHTIDELPKVFNRVFGGKVIWEDRHRLDKKQAAFWEAEVKAFRAYVKDMVDSDKRSKVDSYKEMMSRFDVQQKTEEAERKQAEERASKLKGASDKQKTAQASQERVVKTEGTRLSTLTTKLMADVVANSKSLADADSKQKDVLLQQQQVLLQELSAANAERHQFRLQTDQGYKDAWKQKQDEIAAQRSTTVQSHAAGEREASGTVPAAKPAAAAPAAKAAPAPSGGKAVVSERPSKDGSGNKLVTYSDGTVELVHPDGTAEPAKIKGKK